VVRAEDSQTHNQEDVGLNPTVYWMDISAPCYYTEIKNNKGNQMGAHQKKFIKKYFADC
jgi:hypothetical protein